MGQVAINAGYYLMAKRPLHGQAEFSPRGLVVTNRPRNRLPLFVNTLRRCREFWYHGNPPPSSHARQPFDLVDTLLAIVVGVCLSAACGFRVFVPLLCISLAARANLLELADGWSWLADWPALIAFSVASVAEVAAYYVPWLDHLLDAVATPAAVVAGIVATAACITDMDPFLRWSLAIIAGGGAAGLTQGASVLVRGTSTAATAGFGNFLVATLEFVLSLVVSLLAILAPILALIAVFVVVIAGYRWYWRRRSLRRAMLATTNRPADG
jgi:hypothetical protein